MADRRIKGPDGQEYDGTEIGFQNVREHWDEYLLDDGTVVKLKPPRHGAPDPRLLRVTPGRRYTTVVNLYEFLCGISEGERTRRAAWLGENSIKTFPVNPRDASETFRNLGRLVEECGHVADLLVGATATAERLVVASHDRDFERMDQVIRVATNGRRPHFSGPSPARISRRS
ncbi:MAG: PIN domain-containing protein [Candidatus Rokubacteria bacterium]|nr:PIN domain-containing protein [Candidatus Rokubacteria bacterium]